MISIKSLYPRKIAWFWNKDARVLLIGLYFFTIGIDFGLKRSAFYKHFYHGCGYCKKDVNVPHRLTIVKWHAECRTAGRAQLRRMQKQEAKLVKLKLHGI